jgi:arsenate reductase
VIVTTDYLSEGFSKQRIEASLKLRGRDMHLFVAAAVQAMDDQAALAALAADGKLIKRPFLIANDGRILTGFKEPEWLDLLG